jgi:cell wall-associated NlpC family hydrolase
MGRHSAPTLPMKQRLAPPFIFSLTGLSLIATLPSAPAQASSPTIEPATVTAPIKLVHSTHDSPSMPLSSIKSNSRVVNVAKKYVGRNLHYRYGGNSFKTGIDCSHFVWRVFQEAGYKVPYRSSSALAREVKRVKNPIPGDLVLYRGHVGIYVGNGMMVHHGRSGGAFLVKVYKQNFIGYGRMAH